MISLFGLQLPREELIRRLGDLSQLAGFQQAELTDGQARGVRVIHVWNGSGLEFTVVVDRGMDISHCRYCGVPLAWRSPIGEAHPHAYDPRALGWLKTFYGGLVVTCGLTQAGAPCVDNGEELGLHGRYSHLPAEGLRCETAWEGDDLLIRISGTIREWIMFGPHLTLRRTILTRLGSPWIRLEDIVTNEGTKPSPLMLLYHVNPGWPLVEAGAELVGAVASVRPRDEEAAKGQAYWDRIHEPRAAFREQVFYIDHLADPQGRVEVALVNPSLRRRGLALVLRYPKNELPRFSFWKQLDEKEYVVGLEPATCWVEGRARELARGAVETLAPGESRSFHLEIGVLEGDELSQLRARLQSRQ